MIYDIETKTDLSGSMLVIRFPEDELDRKALYTIQEDQPDFLLPFRYRSVDGQAECTYQLGSHTRLQYRFGSHTAKEYVEFWNQVLQPLLDCDDWFLKPFSFVFDTRYLYVDKNGAVSYLYVPSLRDCEDFASLRRMVDELSRENTVTDPILENKVLKAIMQDFQPKEFLQMLRHAAPAPTVAQSVVREQTPPQKLPVSESIPQPTANKAPEIQVDPLPRPHMEPINDLDNIVINLDSGNDKKDKKGRKEKKPLFGGKKEKPAKPEKTVKKGGFFGKKEPAREIVMGADVQDFQCQPPVWNQNQQNIKVEHAPVDNFMDDDSGVTMLYESMGDACLRLVGNPELPREIPVDVQPGGVFTIGRFDVSVGHKQSTFEFDKKTKAVSRRHAAIERQADGSYVLLDLSSSAGTFVDGQRLTPNVPQTLQRGCRVAFGTAGADYVWEE